MYIVLIVYGKSVEKIRKLKEELATTKSKLKRINSKKMANLLVPQLFPYWGYN